MLDAKEPARISVVTTTVGSMEDANRLGRAILHCQLAACVQLDAIAASLYLWEGRFCAEPEVRLTIKTVPARLAALQAFLGEEHPYELPQFTVVEMTASEGYGEWVAANARGS